MVSRNVQINVIGNASSGAKAIGDLGTKAQESSGRIRSAFGGVASSLSSIGGTALAPITEAFEHLTRATDAWKEHGKTAGTVMLGIGAAATGTGAALMAAGSADKAAQQQLKQAIENTGGAWGDYKEDVEKTIKSQAKYGNTAVDTQNALATLTQATHDPKKALEMMGTAANLAAAKHEDLGTAVTQLGQIINGKGTKVLASLGISHAKVVDSAKLLGTAETNVTKAEDAAAAARQHLTTMTETMGAKHTTSAVQVDQLRKAQDNLTAAEATGNPAKITAATTALQTVRDRLGASTATTAGQQGALSTMQQKVERTSKLAEEAHKKLTEAQDAAAHSGEGQAQTLEKVAQVTKGQAVAASDTFTGKLKALKAEVENQVAVFGQKYGPAITAAGAGMSVLGGATSGVMGIMSRFKNVEELTTAATGAATAAKGLETVAAGAEATAEATEATAAAAADVATLPLVLVIGGIVAAVALLALGIYELYKHWDEVWGGIKTIIGGVWHFIDDTFIKPITHFFSTIIDFIKDHWKDLFAILTGPIGLAVKFISDHFDAAVNFIKDIPDKIVGFFGGIAASFAKIGKDIVNGLVSGIKSMGSVIWDAIKGLIPGGGLIGGALNAIGLAEGGIVTKPTLAMIGEGGYPEVVVPMKNGLSLMGFNDAVAPLTDGLPGAAGLGTGMAASSLSFTTLVPQVIPGAPVGGGNGGGGGNGEHTHDIYLDGNRVGTALLPSIRTAGKQQKANFGVGAFV